MNIKTVTTTTGMNTVVFGNSANVYYWVKNIGSTDITVGVTDNAENHAIVKPDNGIRVDTFTNTVYISGAGTAEIYESETPVCPFKSAPVSGGGSGSGGGLTQLYSGTISASQSKVTTFNADLPTYTALIICPVAAANGNAEYSPSTIIPVSKLSDVFLNFSLFNYVNSTIRDSHGHIKCDNNTVSMWFESNVFAEATIYGI